MRRFVMLAATVGLATIGLGAGLKTTGGAPPRGARDSEPASWSASSSGESAGDCGWQAGFHPDGLAGDPPRFMAVLDDGSGPALYVAGSFAVAGDTTAVGLARWDGVAWSELRGPGGTGLDGWAYTVAEFDDGTGSALYVGGAFATAGGVTVNGIARWDGSAWSALSGPSGTGVSGGYSPEVDTLAVWDDGTGPALYAGGDFLTAGGVTVNHVARWDGTAWSALDGPSGTGVNADYSSGVSALAVFDDGTGPALYIGGDFLTAGGVTVHNIARWDSAAWSPLVGPWTVGIDGTVGALATWNDGGGEALYAGGAFNTAGGATANNIARWNGSGWSTLAGPAGIGVSGGGYYRAVGSLQVFDDGNGPALYVGGRFTHAGGVSTPNLATWDGSAWAPFSPGGAADAPDDAVAALTVFDPGTGPGLYAAGEFLSVGGLPVGRIARWDGTAWSRLGENGAVLGDVNALTTFDDGGGVALYAGGEFGSAGGITVNHVARWNGSAWSALGQPGSAGVDGDVAALASYDDGGGMALYAGGGFTSAGGVAANHVARWNGSGWSPLGLPGADGVNGAVSALAVFDDGSGAALYAGGSFTTAGGMTANHVARWNGTAWSPLIGPSGTGTSGNVLALAVYDDGSGPALYAAGPFVTAGGVTVNSIARWDGSSWSGLTDPGGNTGIVRPPSPAYVAALVTIGDGATAKLYVGGNFWQVGDISVLGLATWDGAAWGALDDGGWHGVRGLVHTLAKFDDGLGEALYVGGYLQEAGSAQLVVNNIARWDGSTWSALEGPAGVGLNDTSPYSGRGYAITVYDDGGGPALYAGGHFATAGGIPAANIAAWRCDLANRIVGDGFESGDTTAWSVTAP